MELDYKSDALRILWRMRSMRVSRQDMAYLLPDLDSPLSWASGEESSDQLIHTDTSIAPHVLHPSDRAPADSHLSISVALSPHYRLNIHAGTALGEAQVERWDKVLLNHREVLIMVSTTHHHAPPPPPNNKCCGPCSHSGPPTKTREYCPQCHLPQPPH